MCGVPDDPKKINHLVSLDGAKERLHLYKANLLEEGSFDSVFQGCHAVFHTASPFYHDVKDPQVSNSSIFAFVFISFNYPFDSYSYTKLCLLIPTTLETFSFNLYAYYFYSLLVLTRIILVHVWIICPGWVKLEFAKATQESFLVKF